MSDSPSTQYRNKSMFYLLTQNLLKEFPQIKEISYNFSESGHGKGPADGIGASIKRTLDNAVKYNNDITNLDRALLVLKERESSIHVSSISKDQIDDIDKVLPSNLKGFLGTMKVHQYSWNKTDNKIFFNSASCFDCPLGKFCKHYNLGSLSYDKNPEKNQKDAKLKKISPISKTIKKQNKKNVKKCFSEKANIEKKQKIAVTKLDDNKIRRSTRTLKYVKYNE